MAGKNKSWGAGSALRRLRRQADAVERAASRHSRRHFFSRLENLGAIRRDIVIWLSLLAVLVLAVVLQSALYSGSYQTSGPAPGGTYAEGVVGDISSFNPLYANTEDEVALSRLVYAGLLDLDDTNHLRPAVAESYTVSDDGLNYEVQLRGDMRWQNSEDVVTADDVVFTASLIQDPATNSPLYDTWRSVKVEKMDDTTVRFNLRSPLAIFPQVLTFGILSKAELGGVKPADLREYLSDHTARGAGPFVYRSTQVSQSKNKVLSFSANPNYFQGVPKVSSISIETFADNAALRDGWSSGEVNVAAGISMASAQDVAAIRSDDLVTTPIDRGVYAIFNTDGEVTSNQAVRKALRLAIDRGAVRQVTAVGDESPPALDTPIAPGIYDSVDKLVQPAYDQTEAGKLLDIEGYAMGRDKTRTSGDKPMRLRIVTVRGSDYVPAAENLAEQWRAIGIDAQVTLAEPENMQQNYLMTRNYDVLVYQLQLGADPDVYAYWHSSGAKAQGLNFANYKSPVADLALSRGRSGINREASYQTFVETWLNDAPAIGLYQSRYFSLVKPGVVSFGSRTLADKSDRFRNVTSFSVNTTTVYTTP
jgi:peptide/nickel transport system substrate-binding protein